VNNFFYDKNEHHPVLRTPLPESSSGQDLIEEGKKFEMIAGSDVLDGNGLVIDSKIIII